MLEGLADSPPAAISALWQIFFACGKILVAADMVEMEMRVDDHADVLRLEAEQLQRAGNGLLLLCCGFSKGSTFMTWS